MNSSTTIVSLLNESPKPVLLLGAGASVTSGIPLAAEIVNKAAKWAYARQNGKDPDDPRITKSDWYPWLKAQSWYNPDKNLADQFPYAIENLLQPQKVRKEFWIKVLNPDVPISAGYLRLVELMHLKRVTNVLTTNFDDCISKARNLINRPHHIDIIKSPDDYTKISSNPPYPCLIYLHGAVENYTDKNVIEEVEKMEQSLVDNLLPILKDNPIIVIGYRGSEASVMEHLLLKNADKTFNYKNGIYWCIRKGESPENVSERVKALAQTIGSNFQFIEIETFDYLFDKVVGAHINENRMPLPPQVAFPTTESNNQEPKNFDLKIAKQYEEGDLDKSLLRIRIINYCEKLNIEVPATVDDIWLHSQMNYLNLLKDVGPKNLPSITNAAVLLFSKEPQQYIPFAKLNIRFLGDTAWLRRILNDDSIEGTVHETIIEGNLWSQVNAINDALALVNKPFRLKTEKSQDVLPYDPIALKEVIVNSIVHRDYESDNINFIEIYVEKIVIKNPGGLMEEVMPYFEDAVMSEEIRKGRRGIKGYRNPVLADLFYSSGEMDKKGSGLYDVVKRAEANSGAVQFSPNEANTQFTVTMWCRPESIDLITNTASPVSVITTRFFTNIIEFKKIPDAVYFSDTNFTGVKEIFTTYENIKFPPFHLFEKKVFSFSDLNSRYNTLRNVIDTRNIDSIMLDEFIALEDGERRFVKMVNDYFKSFLLKKGLVVDMKKKRAYFPRLEETEERAISYQARFKKATRTVVRPKYSVNKEKIRYWEHKAFNFAIKKFGDGWGLLIEPTYVFTLDGYYRLFAPLRVGALATKKASRDYNKNVLNDINFWMWVFSGSGNEIFSLIHDEKIRFGDEIVLSAEYLKTSLNYVGTEEPSHSDDDLIDDEDIDSELGLLAEQELEKQPKEENHDEY